jgi:hypothetical protein
MKSIAMLCNDLQSPVVGIQLYCYDPRARVQQSVCFVVATKSGKLFLRSARQGGWVNAEIVRQQE